jgi:hypothetical protein
MNITAREIATLSFKVLSLYAFIQAIDKLPSFINYMYKYNFIEAGILNSMIFAAPMLLLLLCGGLLWFIAPFLASIISKSDISVDGSAASLLDIQVVAFSVVGLYMLADSLPALVRSVIWHFTGGYLYKSSPLVGEIMGFLVRITIGLWLLFGARGLVNLIRSLRRD